MKRTSSLLLLSALAAGAPVASAAQAAFGPSLEVSFGPAYGAGGTFAERDGMSLDVAVALPSAGALQLGLAAGVTGVLASDLACTVGPGDECLSDFPTLFSLALVGGTQRRLVGGLSSRVLAGPAVFQAVEGGAAIGVQGRVDLAQRLFPTASLVASLRGSLLPRYGGETLRVGAFGLGLRIQ